MKDTRAEKDYILARRAMEAKEREWRAKEQEEAERQTRMRKELEQAREAQIREKER